MARANKGGPKFVKFFGPIIDALNKLGGSGHPSEVKDIIIESLRISDAELTGTISSGASRFSNSVDWARFYLVQAGYVTMRRPILELLVRAMEEFRIEISVGKGSSARRIGLKLPHFTVVGTTSGPSKVLDRLGNLMYAFNLDPYSTADMQTIITSSASRLGVAITVEASYLLAERSNGCPGEALLALKKVHQYAIVYADGVITSATASAALAVFGERWNAPVCERQAIPDDVGLFDEMGAPPVYERQAIPDDVGIFGDMRNPLAYERQAISDDVKMFVWRRDRGHCAKCGSQANLEYDHIIPVSKGGSNTARNIQLLCAQCNRSKGANIA